MLDDDACVVGAKLELLNLVILWFYDVCSVYLFDSTLDWLKKDYVENCYIQNIDNTSTILDSSFMNEQTIDTRFFSIQLCFDTCRQFERSTFDWLSTWSTLKENNMCAFWEK